MLHRLLLRLVPAHWGESIEGDLEEARTRRRATGRRAGALWASLHCGSIVIRLLVEQARHDRRDNTSTRGSLAMTSLPFELRDAARSLACARSTTGIATIVLAVTVGLSTAVFSVADGVLFKPLPYPSPDRLVVLRFAMATMRGIGISLTGGELESARAATSVFEQVEAFNVSGTASRVDGPEPERLRVARVTPGLLPMLGARMAGEGFTREHTAGTGAAVVILTHEYWSARMGADPSVVGTLLRIDGEAPLRILGILNEGFVFPTHSPSLVPQILRPLPDAHLGGRGRSADAIGRLQPGIPPSAVAAAVPVDESVRGREGLWINAIPLDERLAYGARWGLAMLLAGVLGLLGIGLLDVGGLLLVRATSREREIVTRRALGATGGRIMRQLMLEALLLAGAGGALGVLIAHLAFGSLLQLVPEPFRMIQPTGIDQRALLFAALVVMITSVVFGLAPLAHLRRLSATPLRVGGQTRPLSIRRLSAAIVTGQVGMAVSLLLVGVLLVASFQRVRNTPTGFDATRLAFISVTPPPSMLPARGEFYRAALRRLSTIEGVESVALLDVPALRSTVRGTTLTPQHGRVPESTRLVSDTQLVVSPGYFRTAGLDVVDGRVFADEDEANASGVAVVNETVARLWFPGERAVGQRLVSGATSRVIIGVVEDARHFALKEAPLAEVFLPMDPTRPMYAGTFVIRSGDPRLALTPAVAALRALAPTLPITSAETGTDAVARAAEVERFYATLLAVIAGTGLVLAVLGLYGVLAWSVSSRRRELGLRAALGADRRRLAASVAREAVPILLTGAASGAILGWWGARVTASLLHEVSPADPLLWLAAGGIVLTCAAIAMAVPCRRAFLTSPADALRDEA